MATDNRKLYFTDLVDEMFSSGLSGGGISSIITGGVDIDQPYGVTIDTASGYIYYVSQTDGLVQRADLDGSNVTTIADTGDGFTRPIGITLDRRNQKLYVTDFTDDNVRSLNTDGTSVTIIADSSDGVDEPLGIVVDEYAGKLYFVNQGTANNIKKCDLDGSNISTIVTGQTDPQEIGVHHGSGFIFWTVLGADDVLRADLDGNNVSGIVTTGFAALRGLVVDPVNLKVMFADQGATDTITQVDFDGTDQQELLDNGAGTIRGLGLDQIDILASTNLFIEGLFASGTIDLFTFAVNTVSTSGDLFVSGPIQSSGDINLYIANSGVIDSWTAMIKGFGGSINDNIRLGIYGTTTAGVGIPAAEFDLFVQNSGSDVQDPPVFSESFPMFGKFEESDGLESGVWSAFLRVEGSASQSASLFIQSGPNVSGNMPLFIFQDPGWIVTPGATGERAEWSFFAEVFDGISGGIDLFLSGIPASSTVSSGSFDCFVPSHQQISGGFDIVLFGISGVGSGDMTLFIVSETGVINRDSILYTHGF